MSTDFIAEPIPTDFSLECSDGNIYLHGCVLARHFKTISDILQLPGAPAVMVPAARAVARAAVIFACSGAVVGLYTDDEYIECGNLLLYLGCYNSRLYFESPDVPAAARLIVGINHSVPNIWYKMAAEQLCFGNIDPASAAKIIELLCNRSKRASVPEILSEIGVYRPWLWLAAYIAADKRGGRAVLGTKNTQNTQDVQGTPCAQDTQSVQDMLSHIARIRHSREYTANGCRWYMLDVVIRLVPWYLAGEIERVVIP